MAIDNSTIAGRMLSADLEPASVASREDWFAAHNPQRRPLWVASRMAMPSWIRLSDFYGRPAYNGTAEVSIYRDENCRGRGLGHRLLQEAIERAPADGVDTSAWPLLWPPCFKH
ncbi:GNAT family N-acetyltransferase [Vogesella facilis]|uniref:GNAT family N-acetyltransferase n=1 Tax=Vogesella facilis TaxID=1655232 RepID=UPI0036DB5431